MCSCGHSGSSHGLQLSLTSAICIKIGSENHNTQSNETGSIACIAAALFLVLGGFDMQMEIGANSPKHCVEMVRPSSFIFTIRSVFASTATFTKYYTHTRHLVRTMSPILFAILLWMDIFYLD